MTNKRIWQVSLVVGALMAIAGVAAADDTTINSGYDEDNQILILNSYSEGDACTLSTEGDHEVTYAITPEGLVEVESLTSGDDDADLETCEVQAFDVTGPVGQVNQGTFVSAIATLYDGSHRGCVISHFARSGLGQDEQINGPQESEDLDTDSSYTVDFTSIVTDCERETEEDGETASNGNGRPEWAGQGRPEWAGQKGGPNSAGNSGSAPGRDR